MSRAQTSLHNFLNVRANRFIITFLSLFLIFYGFNTLFIGLVAPGGLYSSFLDQHLNYIVAWREFYIGTTAKILTAMGYKVFTNSTRLIVEHHSGIKLIYTCLGYGVMSFFAAFIIAFPKSLKSKLVFLICGLIGIQALNILRFALLALYWRQYRLRFGYIDHHTIFNICIYLIILISIYLWTNTSVKKNATNSA